MWLHSPTYHLNWAASVPSPCIWGCIAHIYVKPELGIAHSSPNPLPVCSGSTAGLPWEAVGNRTDGTSLHRTKWLQTSVRPSSTNPAVLGATFVTMKKDLHSQKPERTPPWGSTSGSYQLDATTFKQKVLPALLQKWWENAVLSDPLPATTRWKKNWEPLQHLKDNSRSNVLMAVLTAHGVFLFHGLEEPHLLCSPISWKDYHLWSRQPQEV